MLFPSTVQAIIMKAKREIKEYHDSDNNDNVAVMMIMRKEGNLYPVNCEGHIRATVYQEREEEY